MAAQTSEFKLQARKNDTTWKKGEFWVPVLDSLKAANTDKVRTCMLKIVNSICSVISTERVKLGITFVPMMSILNICVNYLVYMSGGNNVDCNQNSHFASFM